MDSMANIFKKNFCEAFEKANLTQEELQKKLETLGVKINRNQISFWLNGKTSPRMNKIPAIAKALNCEVNDLLKF